MEQLFTNRKFHFCSHRNFRGFFLNGKRPVSLSLSGLNITSCSGCAQPEPQPLQVYQETCQTCFSSGILVTSILMCGIAISYGPVVCGFSSFLIMVFGKRRSFTVKQYHFLVLSCLNRLVHCATHNTVN